jgi:hypothetical protein
MGSGVALAVAALVALGAPASASASVQITSDPLSAQTVVGNGTTSAEVAGVIMFSTGQGGDTVVALTTLPDRACPRQPPAGVPSYSGPDTEAESLPVPEGGGGVQFLLAPSRNQMAGRVTHVCAYLVRGGIVQARGSRRLTAAIDATAANASKPPASGAGKSAAGNVLLVVLLIVLAALGVRTTLRQLRRWRRTGSELTVPASTGPPPALPAGDRLQPVPAPDRGPGATGQINATRLLRHVSFSPHALERFVERAGLPATRYRDVERIIRELLRQEGQVRTEPPDWARSRNVADVYLQAGEWMLFILRRDRWLPWRYYCVTAVNGPADNTWQNALRRGYIHTPPSSFYRPAPRQLPPPREDGR